MVRRTAFLAGPRLAATAMSMRAKNQRAAAAMEYW
jgi:hypothetical protein